MIFAFVLSACTTPAAPAPAAEQPAADTAAATPTEAPVVEAAAAVGTGGSAIGFLYVGPCDDFGYNQAACAGADAVGAAFPDMEILEAENVPENQEAERVMETMIRQGAKIIFPTSYGHLDPALEVAKRHPDVVFLHQGGQKTAENLGTYFGTIWETVYLSGVAAGHMSKTAKLGYIVAFPIPQVLLNINAFTLGARSINPEIQTVVVFTASWCDPGQQAEATNSLIAQGVDVITQHQDCTKTIIETAERNGVLSVGYHADASALAPEGWITGSIWDWSELYAEIVASVEDGTWKDSLYSGNYRTGVAEGAVKLAPFGKNVPQAVQDEIVALQEKILSGEFFPFEGPIVDQNGVERIAAGVRLSVGELEATNYLIEGVVGTIPQ
ncbi:MAG: BMP family ABC transporter substrate-binding protein [Chloroflexi bacterium]|nr:BMP family ABC transporter substrate-binding protein [Chloroflexota bacterium]